MMTKKPKPVIGVLTSGGDSPGMNAAVRGVVRTALERDIDVYIIYEGYQGMIDGGDRILKADWDSVGGILQKGGTSIGTARCADFKTHEGRRIAARNLIEHRINHLVVIGGDGSLTGANVFQKEWLSLLVELVDLGEITNDVAQMYAEFKFVGLVGSIDNDMFGTDMTIGADTALHRIVEAIDAITSTAASHQRAFVIEVMGRHCGYLALMSALATGAAWVLIPESPPNVDDWEAKMCEVLKMGRDAGRRTGIVIVAEGAQDREGRSIHANYVKEVLEKQLKIDTRVTILGHVQRGGAPSAFDRNLGTVLGYAAVEHLLTSEADTEAVIVGIQGNQVTYMPLTDSVQETKRVAKVIKARDYEKALELRGGGFQAAFRTFRTIIRSFPHPPQPDHKPKRFAVMNAGGPAPGMNTAVRAAVRLGIDKGHTMLGVQNGFTGLIEGEIEELNWMSVHGMVAQGGAELGTNRKVPQGGELYAIARNIERFNIDGLMIIGGWAGYETAHLLHSEQENYPAFNIPILCIPASINNNLPGSELSIGSDTAVNNIIEAVDKIKQSAVASRRCFVVEVMGRHCGYLALTSGIATGAERIYTHEEGVTLRDLQTDLGDLLEGFNHGKRLALIVRNERANSFYTTPFMTALFDEESHDLFDVRQAILGHLQQGGNPSPFDRIQATKFATRGIEYLIEQVNQISPHSAFIGLHHGKLTVFELERFPYMIDRKHQRPKEQWWLEREKIASVMSQSGPHSRRGKKRQS
ncbi:6-phosphofructokinase [Anaerolineales bacterium HSG6]|nr:6-phosphofructokinase [Anaerolineales bacterium HSG6]MDM8531371.1 6-phosphofructokinase [Anaerolineales bacterium HSG25]